jgi:release factor H-coupled RctB family protein
MPDLHPGRGIPVGAAFAFDGVVRPALVGGDAGCGVRCVARESGRVYTGDALLRRVMRPRPLAPRCPTATRTRCWHAAWRGGPARPARAWTACPSSLAGVIEGARARTLPAGPDDAPTRRETSPPRPSAAHFGEQLGTAGGGNHFVEIARGSSAVADRERRPRTARPSSTRRARGRWPTRAPATSARVVAARWHDRRADRRPTRKPPTWPDSGRACRYARGQPARAGLAPARGARRPCARASLGRDIRPGAQHRHARRAWRARRVSLHRKGCAPAERQGRADGRAGQPRHRSWVMRGDRAGRQPVQRGARRRAGGSTGPRGRGRAPRPLPPRDAEAGHRPAAPCSATTRSCSTPSTRTPTRPSSP